MYPKGTYIWTRSSSDVTGEYMVRTDTKLVLEKAEAGMYYLHFMTGEYLNIVVAYHYIPLR